MLTRLVPRPGRQGLIYSWATCYPPASLRPLILRPRITRYIHPASTGPAAAVVDETWTDNPVENQPSATFSTLNNQLENSSPLETDPSFSTAAITTTTEAKMTSIKSPRKRRVTRSESRIISKDKLDQCNEEVNVAYKSTSSTRSSPLTLTALYNQLHKMGQNPRQGPKPSELLVKCPKCPPRSERHNYTAHLCKKTGAFVCTKCLTKGTWTDYKRLVNRNPHFHIESVGALVSGSSGQSNLATDPFERPLGDVGTYIRNLPENPVVFTQLTGQAPEQRRLKPEILNQFLVGLTYLDTNPATITSPKDAIHSHRTYNKDETETFTVIDEEPRLSETPSDGALGTTADILPFVVFPRTAPNDERVKGVRQRGIPKKTEATSVAADLSTAEDPVSPPVEHLDTDRFKVTRFRALSWPNHQHVVFDPVRNAQPGLFGYHLAPVDADTIILTGRELDAMATYQETGIPSVALPTNTYQLPLEEMRLLERFSRIYVWLDDDIQGQEATLRIVNKLGIDRCLIVASRGGNSNGPLNASDALMHGHAFQPILDLARPLGHEQILEFSSLRDAVHQEILNPDDVAGVKSRDFSQYNTILKGLRPGELSIVSGTTGVGKTTILSHLSLDFCQSGVSTLWGSFEIPNVRLAKKMLYQLANKDLSTHQEEFDYWADRFEQLPLYFLKFFGSTQAKTVIEAMKHAVYAYDVQHVVIDNLQFMMTGQGKGYEKWDLQEMALNTFRQFATENNVHVSLVVHPRKENNDKGVLDINSIFGSAKITQDADNVVLIQKVGKIAKSVANEFGDALATRYLDIQKNRFDGTLGKVYLSFDAESLRLRGASPPPASKLSTRVVHPSRDTTIPTKKTTRARKFKITPETPPTEEINVPEVEAS